MTLLIVFCALLALILLITWGKCNAFIAFLVVSIATGLCLGIPANMITRSVQKGIGDTLGSLVVIIMLGAMLGKLVAASGAAKRITGVLMKAFGEKHIQWALMVTGFIVGIPLFYNVGFVLMVPLIFSVVYQYKLPAVYIGLPMLASLSVTHGFLPPHPSPSALVGQFNANMGLTLLYGFLIAIPTIIIAGPVFARSLKNIQSTPLQIFQPPVLKENELPGAANSFLSSLLPVLLLAITALLPLMSSMQQGPWPALMAFIGDPITVMLLSVIVATFTLGIANGKSMKAVMEIYADAVKDVAMIVLIVAGAGVLKQVLVDSGVSDAIAAQLKHWPIPPLVLGWLIAAVLRVCIGSATVAGLTTAGIVAPTMAQLQVEPNLMVLSIGAGSLMFSHVNDAGFWLYKEYFNLSIKDTLRSWSLMETIVAVMGLLGVLLLNLFV
jgi:Gnt-I system high-affinity gluconate transporter